MAAEITVVVSPAGEKIGDALTKVRKERKGHGGDTFKIVLKNFVHCVELISWLFIDQAAAKLLTLRYNGLEIPSIRYCLNRFCKCRIQSGLLRPQRVRILIN